nr:sensor histidine kinase KdpD [Collinsella urealyticum]
MHAIQAQEDEAQRRGHLKIFFGYAAGVGKTYSMLRAMHEQVARGVDAVIGYVEPHARPETERLAQGLESIPRLQIAHAGIVLEEFDLDAAITRAPTLIAVDELAHTNAPGSRHAKRYQDIEELLHAGIDVYTTVNVQHIEGVNDVVASITGVTVRERIPDHIFDEADQVELVDIEPEELIERLQAGSVYRKDQAQRAIDNFFTPENLTALRELALRRTADRAGKVVQAARVLTKHSGRVGEHILVCISASPTCPRIIRSAARMAAALHGPLSALYIETPSDHDMSESDREHLRKNIRLAEQMGATVQQVAGEDIAYQIAMFARVAGVTEIVMGRSGEIRGPGWLLPGRRLVVDRLLSEAPDLDIHIIPDQATRERAHGRQHTRAQARGAVAESSHDLVKQLMVTVVLLALSTGVGIGFRSLGFADASIISLYILSSLVCAITTSGRIWPLVSSVISVVLYNFFFVVPVGTFLAIDQSYLVTFGIMFLTALISSELTGRISRSARQSARIAYRTRLLFETNKLMQQAEGAEAVATIALEQLCRLLGRSVIFYPTHGHTLGEPSYVTPDGESLALEALSDYERTVATWVLANNKHAGASTDTLPQARCLYLAIRREFAIFGVVGILMEGTSLDAFENSIMLSIIGEAALALDRDRQAKKREEARILAKNEQLRADLLRSIGHDLRTPLTTISGAAAILRENGEQLAPERAAELVDAISSDALWLIDIVENLLTVTRIEDGSAHLNLTSELLDDVLPEAAFHLAHQAQNHHIRVIPTEGIVMARMDVDLVMQLLSNLISNAIKYTPAGTTIELSAKREQTWVRVFVADTGPGIPDSEKERIFERFHTASAGKPADAHRSLGLGLALCRSIAEAHGGTIEIHDNHPHGAIFSFTLPAEEVTLRE